MKKTTTSNTTRPAPPSSSGGTSPIELELIVNIVSTVTMPTITKNTARPMYHLVERTRWRSSSRATVSTPCHVSDHGLRSRRVPRGAEAGAGGSVWVLIRSAQGRGGERDRER